MIGPVKNMHALLNGDRNKIGASPKTVRGIEMQININIFINCMDICIVKKSKNKTRFQVTKTQ